MKKASSSTSMEFRYHRGDRVEISNNEEGFVGSYYVANIIAWISDENYIVQYKTLLKDDCSGPLREIVSVDQIRPIPPEILVTDFSSLDVVDAYEKDGWWIGKICRKIGSDYLVKFENTDEECSYPFGMLRIHQKWIDGAWIYSKR